ncbi:MAG: hypothetical protein HY680_05745 [Chloroflexi bacterium]|nr:hypothetical protein [Chloroflexota bacterium]
MAAERRVATKLTLTPHQTKVLQEAAHLLDLDARKLLDILISNIALPLAQAREAALRASLGEEYNGEEAIPPYDWQPGELEKGTPVRYVPGKGFMVEE